MTFIERAEKQFEDLVKSVGDEEIAHQAEDRLHRYILKGIADGKVATIQEAQKVARIGANTEGLDFQRWYS